MLDPISVEVDFETEAGYVAYVSGCEVAGTKDVWEDGTVAADLDGDGRVLGIEILAFDDETIGRARKYAADHGLTFPTHLAEVLVLA
jgi:uncharacterized protein YuzE